MQEKEQVNLGNLCGGAVDEVGGGPYFFEKIPCGDADCR